MAAGMPAVDGRLSPVPQRPVARAMWDTAERSCPALVGVRVAGHDARKQMLAYSRNEGAGSLYSVRLTIEAAERLEMIETQAANGPTDAELITAWRDGDEAAAAALVRRYTRSLARFLAAAGARQDLEDLMQETFFRAFRRIDSFRGEAGFRTWLFAIGSNALKDLGRRRQRSPFVPMAPDEEFADEQFAPHGQVEEGEAVAKLERAVAGLPRMQREVFLMRAQQGITYEEIAEALDTTVGAARVHYHHAVKRLKAVLD